jgi:hypothetical protein
MRMCLKLLPLVLIFFTGYVSSQSLPTNHWVYDSVRKLQVIGALKNLSQGSLPYSRLEIAAGLIAVREGQDTLSNLLHPEVRLLMIEFQSEIQFLDSNPQQHTSEYVYSQFDLSSKSASSRNHDSRISARISYNIHSKISLQYGAILDQGLIHDSTYVGYEWRGFSGYQDQLFIQYNSRYTQILFGREYLKWGYGHTGNLFISDNSRPFDMLKMTIMGKHTHFESFVAQLDQMYGAERYLTGTRFALMLWSSTVLGVGQSALYGGIHRSIDFTLSNPLAFYSFSQDNDQKQMNGMLYADLSKSFGSSYKIYGELLIDDFQVDREEKSDLEPNEIAFMIGVEGVQVFDRLDFWLELIQVRNRTYNVPGIRPWEKFLHRGKPISHPYGTDFQLLSGNVESWLFQNLKGRMNISILRKGEGTVNGPFTEPWMEEDLNFESGYSENVPSGVVETSTVLDVGLLWRPTKYFSLDASIASENKVNTSHIIGTRHSGMIVSLNLSAQIDKIYYLPQIPYSFSQ